MARRERRSDRDTGISLERIFTGHAVIVGVEVVLVLLRTALTLEEALGLLLRCEIGAIPIAERTSRRSACGEQHADGESNGGATRAEHGQRHGWGSSMMRTRYFDCFFWQFGKYATTGDSAEETTC